MATPKYESFRYCILLCTGVLLIALWLKIFRERNDPLEAIMELSGQTINTFCGSVSSIFTGPASKIKPPFIRSA